MMIKWFPQVIAGAPITPSWGKQTAAAEDVCQHAGESSSYKYGLYSTLPKIIAERTMPPETLPDAKIARWVQDAGPIYQNQTINICSCCTQHNDREAKGKEKWSIKVQHDRLKSTQSCWFFEGEKKTWIISAGSKILKPNCVFYFNMNFLSMGKRSEVLLSYLKTYKNSKLKTIKRSTNRGRSCPTASQRQTLKFLFLKKKCSIDIKMLKTNDSYLTNDANNNTVTAFQLNFFFIEIVRQSKKKKKDNQHKQHTFIFKYIYE